MNKEISVGLNIIRIVACFMVIVLHMSAMGLQKTNDSWVSLNFIDSLTRACVPLFIMISGALLIKDVQDSPSKITKRILKIFACLFFWSFIYILRDRHAALDINNIFGYIHEIFSGPVKY
ncbi:acyltransferase family protein, partial [Morganella morganii subsp. sibonii]